MKKPRLEQTVYTILNTDRELATEISIDQALWLGKESFVICVSDAYIEEAREWFYEDYGTKWFTTLASAKSYLREYWKKKEPNNHAWKFIDHGDYLEITCKEWE